MDPQYLVVAIDGPAASGKSSVAKTLATRLNFAYINSGSMYRAVAWLAHQKRISVEEPDAVVETLRAADFVVGLRNKLYYIEIDGVNPESHLKEEVVNRTVSSVAAVREIREHLLGHLRNYANLDNVVMEGRDIGSTVFPETPFKFYIDANPEVRARRRAAQGLKDNLVQRDRLDSSRRSSPLVIAPDAEVVDSSSVTIESVVDRMLERLKLRGLAFEPGVSR